MIQDQSMTNQPDPSSTGSRMTIGVLGGMGPAATLDLFSKILALTPASCDEEHLNLQIDNNPVPGAKLEPLCARARRLEACGVDFIVMPCNAAHEYYPAVQASVRIPVVNMIREAARAVRNLQPAVQKVAVLAWSETLCAGLYQDMLAEFGLQPIIPAAEQWQVLIDLINAVKSGDGLAQKPAVVALGSQLVASGAEAIILGCTELPLILSQQDFSVPVIDATHVLAATAVDLAMRKISFYDMSVGLEAG
jgi:aspartate racemase